MKEKNKVGRPKGIETTTIRVPSFLKPIITRWINKKLKKHVEHASDKNNS
jgi:hypothetical protein